MALSFRLFGIPIRIHVFFLLIVFQGVLMHELGHALVGRAFGLKPRIDLMAFWGLTHWEPGPDGRTVHSLSPLRLMVISFAGPLVGLVIGGGALAALLVVHPEGIYAWTLLVVVYVNLVWAVYNLLPVLPLDGGHIMAAIFLMFSKDRGMVWARYTSLAFIVALSALAIAFQAIFLAMILFFFGFMNYRALQAEQRLRASGMLDVRTPEDALRVAYAALERGEGELVSRCAVALLQHAPDASARDEALHLLAWGQLLIDQPGQAQAALDRMSGERDPDPALSGAVLLALGRFAAALDPLEQVLAAGPSEFAEKRYIRAVTESGNFERAAAFVEANPAALSARSLGRLQAAALQAELADVSMLLGMQALRDEGVEPLVAFNVACATALLGRPQESLDWLVRARELGFEDLTLLDGEDDLEPVRALDGWAGLRASFGR
jgi:Zn-dependent protease